MEKDIYANWYVAIDPDSDMHVLKSRRLPSHVGVSHLNRLMEARSEVDDPELILENSDDAIIIRDPNGIALMGILDIWITAEQDQAIVLSWVRIDLKEFDLSEERVISLVTIPDRPTTVYYSGRVQRIKDARRS